MRNMNPVHKIKEKSVSLNPILWEIASVNSVDIYSRYKCEKQEKKYYV